MTDIVEHADVDWNDAEKLKADLFAVLCERNEMATEIIDLRAEIERLRALSAELCEAMDDCITWLSSGFAPQSQAVALEKAAKARAKFRALEHKP